MPSLCTKCKDCQWENLLPHLNPCDECFEDNNFEPKTTVKSDSLWSTGQSGDGSGEGGKEADEASPAGKPLGSSLNIQSSMRTEEEQRALILRHRNKDGRWRKKRSDVGKPRKRLNINGGKIEDLDPELQSILKHRKRTTVDETKKRIK